VNGTGPYLAAALVCERVLQEQDGVVSAIRIIDRVMFIAESDGTLMQPVQPIVFLIQFKSGSARGRYSLTLRMEKPSGEEVPLIDGAHIFFEGEERGVNVVLNAGFEPDQEGLYWFDLLFEGERVTRIPLRAIYQPLPRGRPGR
jgi:hypothetical protein